MARTEMFGRSQPGGMFAVVNEGMTTGNIFFVHSGTGTNGPGYGQNPDSPVATLAYAIGLCTANKGDRIYLMPDHSETVTGAGGVTVNVAGVSILGMGRGNQRPKLLLAGGTTVTMLISAADVYVGNVVFEANFADIVAAIAVTGVYAHIDRCEFVDNVDGENFKSGITCSGSDNTANGLKVTSCRFMTPDAATLGFILTTGDVQFAEITDNLVISEGTGLATLITCATGKDLKKVAVLRNFLSSKATAGNLFISNDTASPNNSGIIAHNRCGHSDVTTGHILGVVGGCRMFDNLSVSTDSASGFVIPAIDVDS